MRLRIGQRVFLGTPLQIVQAMQGASAAGRLGISLGEYIDWAIENARQGDDGSLNVVGATDAERAVSLVAEMVRTGFAVKA